MSRFSEIKKVDNRSVIIDFPYEDEEIKVCLKVLPVVQDLLATASARDYAKSKGVAEPTEKIPDYSMTLMAEIIARATYECVKSESGEWKATQNKFFTDANEIINNLDQDLLLYLHEYYQNFRSITGTHSELTAENVALISHMMGGEGSEEDKANFFCRLQRHLLYSYLRFTGSVLLNSLKTSS